MPRLQFNDLLVRADRSSNLGMLQEIYKQHEAGIPLSEGDINFLIDNVVAMANKNVEPLEEDAYRIGMNGLLGEYETD